MADAGQAPRQLFVRSSAEALDAVLVAVRDTGPGLRPESLHQLFDAFYTTKPVGLGMGLSICRSIVEAHGAWLWAAANAPKGAVFQFTLAGTPRRYRCPLKGAWLQSLVSYSVANRPASRTIWAHRTISELI
jgi:signal transduction histidine kinase